MILLREATEGDLGVVADSVARQPLMIRYGTTADALERNLAAALSRGEELLLSEVDGDRKSVV